MASKSPVEVPAGNPNQTQIPEDLDYDFWCGPSKMLPYNGARLNFHWRWNLNYGGGQLMDWIGHHNDIAHWGLGEDRGGPIEVETFTGLPERGMDASQPEAMRALDMIAEFARRNTAIE